MCLCNEVDGTTLAHLRASQWCFCSKELRITVPRSVLCCCCSTADRDLPAVFVSVGIHGKVKEILLILVEIQMKYL